MENITIQESNHVMIERIVRDVVDNILDKWLNIILYPKRLIMIYTHWCSVCDSTHCENEINVTHCDTARFHGRYGWTFCNKCSVYSPLIKHYYYYNYTDYIQRSACRVLKGKPFAFYRKSSNRMIEPYIEYNGYYDQGSHDFIHINIDTQNINVIISWDDKMKSIDISNLIFYNRSIFGYEYENFPIQTIPRKMKPLLRSHYNHCKEWYTLECVFKRSSYQNNKHIPDAIQRVIFRYWNNLSNI